MDEIRTRLNQIRSTIQAKSLSLRKENPNVFEPKNVIEYINNSEKQNNGNSNRNNPDVLNGLKISAVDSGFVSRNFFGIDIMLIRTAGVVFEYDNSKLIHTDYIPKSQQVNYEFNTSGNPAVDSLIRLNYELELAIKMLENNAVDVLLFDGSLLPLPTDILPKSSPEYNRYKLVLNNIGKLMDFTFEDKIIIGVIKDSKSTHISKILKLNTRDILLMDYMLKENEYTGTINVDSGDIKELDWSSRIAASYLKPLEYDLPLRIEFSKEQKDNVIPIMFSLCKFSKLHAYPPPLIEADLRARFNMKEINSYFSHIQNTLGIKPMRRYNRPFK